MELQILTVKQMSSTNRSSCSSIAIAVSSSIIAGGTPAGTLVGGALAMERRSNRTCRMGIALRDS